MTSRRTRPPGFSLLEVLVAIGLIVMLSAGMFYFYTYSIESRARTQRAAQEAQLAQAVLKQIADDLNNTSVLTALMQQQSTSSRVRVLGLGNATPAAASPADGVVGAADSISFQTSRCIPASRFVKTSVADEQTDRENRMPLYDVQQVRWVWNYDAETNVSSGLVRIRRPAVVSAPVTNESLTSGAAEDTPDDEAAAAEPADDEFEDDPPDDAAETELPPDPLAVTEEISPEVQWMHLRYYDGTSWSDTYQGGSGPTPVAVEITIGFEPLLSADQIATGTDLAKRLKQLFGDEADQPLPPRSYQTVVYLIGGELTASAVRPQNK